MSRIFQVTTIRTEDFPSEQRQWMPRLLTPINLFITNVTQLLNGRVQFVDNIPARDVNLSFSYAGRPQRFRWDLPLQPNILWVGRAFENGALIPLCSTWNYDADSDNVIVDFFKLTGATLTQGAQYRIFVRVVP